MKKRRRNAGGFSYFLVEGVRGIFLHGFTSFAAVGVIVACLLIMGSFALLAVNIDAMIREIEQSSQIVAFIDEELTDAAARGISSRFPRKAQENIKNSEFVSRRDALDEFAGSLEERYQRMLTGYDDNDLLRHRVVITLMDITRIEETIEQIETVEGVAWVRSDQETARELATVRRVVEAISAALIVILLLVSVFIIANTIKLATFDRREEIGIMRIVGATKAFVRWPFVVEGVLLGLCASVTGFFAQGALYSWFTGRVLGTIALLDVIPFSELMIPIAFAFVLVGFLVGVGGSLLTIRKFLRV
ncbi:MAG: ABC transporter permease [Oscillospiraceae bacterium]|nr:ABC transporter permease [Oscillospiraceae bacterium]